MIDLAVTLTALKSDGASGSPEAARGFLIGWDAAGVTETGYTSALPARSTVAQNGPEHETDDSCVEPSPAATIRVGPDQPLPSNRSAWSADVTAAQNELLEQETSLSRPPARANGVGGDQTPSSKLMAAPSVIAMQNEVVGQERELTSPIASGADQLPPSNVSTFPASSAATQNELVGHDTSSITLAGFGWGGRDQPVPL